MIEELDDDEKAVAELLRVGDLNGLTEEVICSVFRLVAEGLSIQAAVDAAIVEWDL
jgi:hypothetical protein